jgi:ABC-type glycerol-3-phosphate transport system permease component
MSSQVQDVPAGLPQQAAVEYAAPTTPTGAPLPIGKLHEMMQEGLKHGVLLFMLACSFFPFVFMVYSSLKTEDAITHHFWSPPYQANHLAVTENYSLAWKVVSPYIKNSLIVTSTSVLGVLIVATLASYAFARFRFPGSQFFFYMVIALLMIPGILTLIASFMWVKALFWIESWNLIDSYWVLIVPGIAGAQVGAIFLCRGFFAALPKELFEAAFMDGASDLQVIWHIVLPLSKPILGTVAVMNILGTWNEFMWPLLTTGDKNLYTIAIGLRYFQGQFATSYGPLFAGYTIASIPLIVLFLMTMRHFIAGLTSGAIKA